MHWYTVNNNFTNTFSESITTTPINTNSIAYKANEVDIAYSVNLQGPAIVQVGCPHNITNGADERFCVSIVFIDAKLRRRPTMSEATSIFKAYLL
jgi:hypothetical protein